MDVNAADLLTDRSTLPFSPNTSVGQSGYFKPQVFLFREGGAWRADLLRIDEPDYDVTLSFSWWLERADGRWQVRVMPQCVTIVSDGALVERLPAKAVDALVAFLVKHWPKAAPDMLRILLEHPELKLLQGEPRQAFELTLAQRDFIIGTARSLKGFERRIFMARVVQVLNMSQRHAAKTFRWCRNTLRKGARELKSGARYPDRYSDKGRRCVETRLPDLLVDIKDIQAAVPFFRVTVNTVRLELVRKGYCVEKLPCDRTIYDRILQALDQGLF
jgi:hypothetical protein